MKSVIELSHGGSERSQRSTPPASCSLRITYQRLPPELREMIIEHAMRNSGHLDSIVHVVNGDKIFAQGISKMLPSICFASKQAYQDAFPIFARNVWWDLRSVSDTRHFENLLNKVPLGLKNLRKIVAQNFEELPMDFLRSLPTLTRVKLVFHSVRLQELTEPPMLALLLTRRWSRRQIVEALHIDRIFDYNIWREWTSKLSLPFKAEIN